MTKQINENCIRAYEEILEQSRLEAYFRCHLPTLLSDGTSPQLTQSDDEEDGQGNSVIDEEEWTDADLDLFFISLARHSRLRCDLIAKDLCYRKSASQVAQLIHLFEQQKQSQKVERNVRRKIDQLPSACEVSQEWLEVEDTISSRLHHWEEMQYKKLQAPGIPETQEHPNRKDLHSIFPLIDWEEQVLNAILFLRHCHQLDPKQNKKNAKLKVKSSQEKIKVFAFSVQNVIDVLNSKDDDEEEEQEVYPLNQFASDHCVPDLRPLHKNRSTAWRIVYRAIELGFMIPIRLKKEKENGKKRSARVDDKVQLPSSEEFDEMFKRIPNQILIWNEEDDGANALQEVRASAAERMLRSLTMKEAEWIINVAREKDAEENSSSQQEKSTFSLEKNWNTHMIRFIRIGISKKSLLNILEPIIPFNTLSLFQGKGIIRLLRESVQKEKVNDGIFKDNERISIYTIERLAVCLKLLIYRTLEYIQSQSSHSLRDDVHREAAQITSMHVRHAIRQISDHCISAEEKEREETSFPEKAIRGEEDNRIDPAIHALFGLVGEDEASSNKHIVAASEYLQGLKSFQAKFPSTVSGKTSAITAFDGLIIPSSSSPLPSSSVDVEMEEENNTDLDEDEMNAKEEKELERWEIISKQDLLKDKEQERYLWSRIGIDTPDSLHYHEDYQDEREEQEIDGEEQENDEEEEEDSVSEDESMNTSESQS